MTRRQLRGLRMLATIVLVAALVGALYGFLMQRNSVGALIGGLYGVMISLPIGLVELAWSVSVAGRRIVTRLPFALVVLAKSVLYGAAITLPQAMDLGPVLLGLKPFSGFIPWSRSLTDAMVFSVAVSLVVNFLMQLSLLVGPRTFLALMSGRYHQPVREERFFLFADLRGSTRLAEQLGDIAYHRFLNRVFIALSGPVTDERGEIVQYVGDEMVVTWPLAIGRHDARPLRCWFALQRELDGLAAEFERDFGARPQLHGALHAGTVVTGEIGAVKRDIVFHGDVMNTTARLEQATRDLQRPFLVSGPAWELIEGREAYHAEALGTLPLRGKQEAVAVLAVQPSHSPIG